MADMNDPGKEGSRNEDGVNPEKKPNQGPEEGGASPNEGAFRDPVAPLGDIARDHLRGLSSENLQQANKKLLAALEDRDPNIRADAAAALAQIGRPTGTVPALVNALRNSSGGTEAADALKRYVDQVEIDRTHQLYLDPSSHPLVAEIREAGSLGRLFVVAQALGVDPKTVLDTVGVNSKTEDERNAKIDAYAIGKIDALYRLASDRSNGSAFVASIALENVATISERAKELSAASLKNRQLEVTAESIATINDPKRDQAFREGAARRLALLGDVAAEAIHEALKPSGIREFLGFDPTGRRELLKAALSGEAASPL